MLENNPLLITFCLIRLQEVDYLLQRNKTFILKSCVTKFNTSNVFEPMNNNITCLEIWKVCMTNWKRSMNFRKTNWKVCLNQWAKDPESNQFSTIQFFLFSIIQFFLSFLNFITQANNSFWIKYSKSYNNLILNRSILVLQLLPHMLSTAKTSRH